MKRSGSLNNWYKKKGYRLTDGGNAEHIDVYFMETFDYKRKGWEVHHCDGNKMNNYISNLVYVPREVHEYIHRSFPPNNLPTKKFIINEILKVKMPDYKEPMMPTPSKSLIETAKENRLKLKPKTKLIKKFNAT